MKGPGRGQSGLRRCLQLLLHGWHTGHPWPSPAIAPALPAYRPTLRKLWSTTIFVTPAYAGVHFDLDSMGTRSRWIPAWPAIRLL